MRDWEWLSLFRCLCFRDLITPFNRVWAGVGEPVEVAGEAGGVAVAVVVADAVVDAEAVVGAVVEEANRELSTQSDSGIGGVVLPLFNPSCCCSCSSPTAWFGSRLMLVGYRK